MSIIRLAMLILVIAAPTAAQAQIVRFGMGGGVSVRAPFVRVDVSPYGGTQVRAPFTSVDTGGSRYRGAIPYGYSSPSGYSAYGAAPYSVGPSYRAYYSDRRAVVVVPQVIAPIPAIPLVAPPRYDIPSYADVFPPTVAVPSSSSRPVSLADRLADSAGKLRRSLARSRDESTWVGYLQPGAIESLADRLYSGRGFNDITTDEVRGLIANFDGVSANPDLNWLSRSAGFHESRAALAELLTVLGEQPAEEFMGESVREDAVENTTERANAESAPTAKPTENTKQPMEELPAPVPDAAPAAKPVSIYRGEA